MGKTATILELIAEYLGQDIADQVQRQCGGTVIFLPRIPQADHKICQVVGLDLTIDLVDAIGSGQIWIPKYQTLDVQARNFEIRKALGIGLTYRDTAKSYGVSTRTISRLKERDKVAPPLPLFDISDPNQNTP